MVERFMIAGPDRASEVATTRVVKGMNKTDKDTVQAIHTYEDAELGDKLIWTAAFPLPEIGDMVYITMNGIGYAKVKGYFASHLESGDNYIGTMCLAICPPEWLVKQNAEDRHDMRRPDWYRAGIGCEFGTEIRPLAEGEVVPPVAALAAERKRKAAAWKRKVAKERKAERAAQEAKWAADAAEKAADEISIEITVDAAWAEVDRERMEKAIDREIDAAAERPTWTVAGGKNWR